ncbi:MAG: hypothetical protein ABI599_07060 [Flavobacteriales bacterium]
MRSALVIGMIGLVVPAWAQQPMPVAQLDSTSIRIGEQVRLKYSIAYRMDQGGGNIQWPAIGDTLPQHIEIVHDSGVDTIIPDKQNDPYAFVQSRTLTITSFDSGYWAIEPLRFVVQGDTVESNALVLTVNTVEVDTAQAIRDIKDIYEVQFNFMEWLKENWPWVAGGAAVLAAVIAGIVLLLRRKPNEKSKAPEPLLPLHVRMLAALEEIDRKRLWQQGMHKQYQTEVTDLLRGYVEQRFGTPALEKTTDELLQELKLSSMHSGHREQLGNILRLADLVKFAKLTPAPIENEQLMSAAVRLVQETTEQASGVVQQPPNPTAHAR